MKKISKVGLPFFVLIVFYTSTVTAKINFTVTNNSSATIYFEADDGFGFEAHQPNDKLVAHLQKYITFPICVKKIRFIRKR